MAGQVPWPFNPAEKPGNYNGAPIFSGVRVVEISTVIAVPSVGRVLADLGVEVIKVEGPGRAGRGEDPFRTLMLPFSSKDRKKRGVGVVSAFSTTR